MRYVIDYRDATGRPARRIVFAQSADEVRAVIEVDRLRQARVTPPLPKPPTEGRARLPRKEGKAVLVSGAKRPAKRGTPLVVEIISRPAPLKGDPTGGKLPWMEAPSERDEERTRALQKARAARARAGKKKKAKGKRPFNSALVAWPRTGRGPTAEECLVEAAECGDLEVGVPYLPAEIKDGSGNAMSGGIESVALRLAANGAPIRLVKAEGRPIRWMIERVAERKPAA